jgi:hypothetical protein
MTSPCCLSVNPPINFRMSEPVFVKFGVHMLLPELFSAEYFRSPSQSVCIPPIVARQRLLNNVTAVTHTRQLYVEHVVLYAVRV